MWGTPLPPRPTARRMPVGVGSAAADEFSGVSRAGAAGACEGDALGVDGRFLGALWFVGELERELELVVAVEHAFGWFAELDRNLDATGFLDLDTDGSD